MATQFSYIASFSLPHRASSLNRAAIVVKLRGEESFIT